MKLPLKLALLRADYITAAHAHRAALGTPGRGDARELPTCAAVRSAGAAYADALESWLSDTPAGQGVSSGMRAALLREASMSWVAS